MYTEEIHQQSDDSYPGQDRVGKNEISSCYSEHVVFKTSERFISGISHILFFWTMGRTW
jgi:hypothetical protein